jgi:predicted metal-binding protein
MKTTIEARIEKLRKHALDVGAHDAKVIPSSLISIEDQVLEMCKKPFCDGYGKSANCPPHTMKPGDFREFIKAYDHAIIFKIDVSVADMMSDKREGAFTRIYEIATNVEAAAKADGLELSTGYAAGSCKPVFCQEHKVCQVLVDKTCRNPSLARPSMEAVGMNVMKAVQDAGWEIQEINTDSDPDSFPDVVLAGLVLVA